jgi:hypothetical protein
MSNRAWGRTPKSHPLGRRSAWFPSATSAFLLFGCSVLNEPISSTPETDSPGEQPVGNGTGAPPQSKPAPKAPPSLFAPASSYPTGDDRLRAVVADFDGDKQRDIVVLGTFDPRAFFLRGGGDGTFGAPLSFEASAANSAVATDLDGDGKLDLAAATVIGPCGGAAVVLLNAGSGTFRSPVCYATSQNPVGVAVGDLDRDGLPDLLVTHDSAPMAVLKGTGRGTFAKARSLGQPGNPESPILLDQDGDGLLDLVSIGKQLAIATGDGKGGFATLATVDLDPLDDFYWVATGDFNRDSRPDYVVGGVSTAELLTSDGSNDFLATPSSQPIKRPLVADFNGDGRVDIAGMAYGDRITVLLGRGDGTFENAISIAAGASMTDLVVADLNADGKPDLVAVNGDARTVSIFLNAAR